MLTVTQEAKELLTEMLEQNKAPDEAAVRLATGQGGGLQAMLDTPKAEDETFDHNGRTVLVVDKSLSESLGERSLKVEQAEGGGKTLAFG